MLTLRHAVAPVLSLLLLSADLLSAHAQTNYPITDFTKTDDIYTNLNEQYPHTGTGVPGSGVGTPNQTFVFNPATYTSPNAVGGANQTTNGVTFTLTSDAGGRDFTEVQGLPGSTLTIPVSVPSASSVHLLINGYTSPTANFTFTASGGVSETFNSVQLHDFASGGSPRNDSLTFNGSPTPNLLDQTVFQVVDTGAGGSGNSTNGFYTTYGLDEDSFLLTSAFAGQTLQSISVTANGFDPILLGVTVTGAAGLASTPEPSSVALFASSAFVGLTFLRRRSRTRKMA